MLVRVISDIWRSMFPRPAAPESALALAEKACVAFSTGHRALGIEYAERALAQDPQRPEPRDLLRDLYLHGRNYDLVIADIHRHLKPRSYIEIGVAAGKTLALAGSQTRALGIDPAPEIPFALAPNTRVFAETSDAFFAGRNVRGELGGVDVDLAFIDGMHRFEFALRDFINLERLCGHHSTILLHDCFAVDRMSAQRERMSGYWSGDVWRLIVLLKRHRPDLRIHTIAAPPTGLAVIRGLDPASRVLPDNLERLVAEYMKLDYSYLDDDRAAKLNLVPNDWEGVRRLLDAPVT